MDDPRPGASGHSGSKSPVDSTRPGSISVAAGIGLSRLSGLIREILLRSILALGPAADAFAAALRIPNLLQNLLGEGSLSASFIPVYSRLLGEGRREEAGRVAAAIAGFLTLIAGALILLAVIAARPIAKVLAPGFDSERLDLTADLLQITTAGLGLLVLSAWCLGILNSHGRFFLPYVAPVLWNAVQISVLITALLDDWSPRKAAVGVAWGLVIGGALQFAVQVIVVWRLAPEIKVFLGRTLGCNSKPVRQIGRRFGPAVLGRGVIQLSGYLDLILASLLVTGAVSGLLSAQILYGLPVALFATSVAASTLPSMSRTAEASALASPSLAARRQTAFFVSFSTVAYLILGEPIVNALFGWRAFDSNDGRVVALILVAYTLGLPAVTASRIHQNTLFALGDTASPARIAALRVLLATAVGVLIMFPLDRLTISSGEIVSVANGDWFGPLAAGVRSGSPDPHLGAVGLALGSAIAAWVELGYLVRRVRSRIPDLSGPATVLGPLVPAIAASMATAILLRLGTSELPDVAGAPISVGGAFLIYVFVAAKTNIAAAREFLSGFRSPR